MVFATYFSTWSNRTTLVEGGSARACTVHADCGQYEFCFGKVGFGNGGEGVCQNFFTEMCTEELPCDVGDGDCDTDFDCVSDLVCGALVRVPTHRLAFARKVMLSWKRCW